MSTGLTARYEELRSDVLLDSRGHGQGLGMALFLHRGMLAWMRAWPGLPACSPQQAYPEPRPLLQSAPDSILPPDVRSQMTAVVAAMILGQQQEACYER